MSARPVLKKKVPTITSSPTNSSAKLPKEEKKDGIQEPRRQAEEKKKSTEGTRKRGAQPSPPAAEPVVSSGESAPARRPRAAAKTAPAEKPKREFNDPIALPKDGQVSLIELHELSFSGRHELWKTLNKGAREDEFVTLLYPHLLPKGIRKELPPAVKPNKEALWCSYCEEWMKFRSFSYTGYDCCIGCGISTKDFHIVRANKLTS